MRWLFSVAILLCSLLAKSETELIINGNFSSSTKWTKWNNFYIDARFDKYRSPSAYAYLSQQNGDPGNSLSGQITQTVTIPSNATSAKFKFYYSISTNETTNSAVDHLVVTFSVNNVVKWTASNLSNVNKTTTSSAPNYQSSGTLNVPTSLYGQEVQIAFHGTTDGARPTVFRIDDVSLVVETPSSGGGGTGGGTDGGTGGGGIGGSSNCITWTGGTPDSRTQLISKFLCEEGILPQSTLTVNSLSESVSVQEICMNVFRALLREGMPLDFMHYPSIQTVSDYGIHPDFVAAVKAMLFLEYNDGVTPLNRDYIKIGIQEPCSIKKALRIICEALDIAPEWDSYYDKFSNSTQNTPYNNIKRNDPYYGYLLRAKEENWLSQITSSSTLPEPFTRKQLWELLYAVFREYTVPIVSKSDFFEPNNFSVENSNIGGGIERGIFNDYQQSLLSIPTYSFPLQFSIGYHSDLTEIPSIAREVESNANLNHINLQRMLPLGRGWTHSYHFTVQISTDKNGDDEILVLRWPDGTTQYYDYKNEKYLTLGIYDKLKITETSNNGKTLKKFTITSKDNIIYTFTRDSRATILYLTSLADRNDNRVTLTYSTGEDADGTTGPRRLDKVSVDNTEAALLFTYQSNTNFLKRVEDNTGRYVSFTIDKESEILESMKNAKGTTTTYYYGNDNQQHLLTEIILPKGNKITNSYQKRKLKQTSNGTYTIAVAFTPTYTANATTSNTTLTINNQGSATKTITYSTNKHGLTTIIKSKSEDISITYDTKHPTLPKKIVDNNTEFETSYEYDDNGNTKEYTIDGDDKTSITHRYQYNDDNTIKYHILPNLTKLEYEYNSAGNLTRVHGPLDFGLGWSRNTYGQITQQKLADGSATNFEYNGKYKQLSKKILLSTVYTESAEYDAQGRISALVNSKGIRDEISYDEHNNITQYVQDVKGLKLTTSYTYDENDNVTRIVNPNNRTTYLTYDSDTDDLIEEQYGQYFRQWSYRQDGKLDKFTSKKGQSFSYSYYPRNDNNEGKLRSNGYQRFTYDPDTQQLLSITSEQNQDRVLSYEYDGLLRPESIKFASSQFSSQVNYEYDDIGNLSKISIPSQNKAYRFEYDEYMRTKRVHDWKDTAVVYTYTMDGKVAKERYKNGVIVHYKYNYAYAGRCDSIWSTRTDGTLIHAVGCSYDSSGKIIRESLYIDTIGIRFFNYAPLSQSTTTHTYGSDDRLEVNGNSVTDGNGNILSYGSVSNASYDRYDNLVSVRTDGKDKIFEYDALEQRYRNGNLYYGLDYLSNANVLYVKPTASAAPSRFYLHSEHGLVCELLPSTGEKRYYLYDMRGSNIALIGEDQKVVAAYKYDPFGTVVEATEEPGKATPFLFVGKYGVMYEGSQLYYMRARYYDPSNGRFLGEDPIWNTNLYPYAGNDPVNGIDPNGEFLQLLVGAAISVGVGYIGSAISGQSYTWKDAGKDALLGVGLGIVGKGIGIAASAVRSATMKTAASAVGGEVVKTGYTFTKTASKHLTEVVKHGENAGQLSRPYMKSPLTIQEIMSTGKGIPDATFKGGLNWKVPGTFRGSKGFWELGINPKTNVIYHFNFVR